MKWVKCTGKTEDVKDMWAWFHSLLKYSDDYEDTMVFDEARVREETESKRFYDEQVTHDLNFHEITCMGFRQIDRSTLCFEFDDVTPYGNMTKLLYMLRVLFPKVDYKCFASDGEGGEEENEED
jgi:hypothetical protein